MGWWVNDLFHQSPMLLISWAVWVVVSICLHELGHGWAAIRLGDRTPIELGHMTWNPLVHMGPMSLVMFAIVGIAWGAMPVSPHRLKGRFAQTKVALAGPGVNLILAVGCVLLAGVWIAVVSSSPLGSSIPDGFAENLRTFLVAGAFLNVVLLALNLIPAPPLDGSRVLADLSPAYRRVFFESPQGAYAGLGVLLLIFIFGGQFIFPWAIGLTMACVDAVAGLFGAAPAP